MMWVYFKSLYIVYLNLFLEWVSFICMLKLIVCINILDKWKAKFQFEFGARIVHCLICFIL